MIHTLQIENLKIEFDKPVIENGSLKIQSGCITAVTGKSGSGKTSLLYALGLISSSKDYTYIFNGDKIDLKSDKETGRIRKTQIGYIFQDNSLVDTLSIAQNIRLSAELSGRKISNDEIKNLLLFVHLDTKTEDYPNKLSGGERQRLAIACALSKKPELILADEPTSSLDSENEALILSILQKIAHDEHKMVVIATHNQNISSQADVVYTIEKCCINLVGESSNDSEQPAGQAEHTGSRLNFPFYWNYAKNSAKKHKIQKRIMLAVCSVAVALSTVSYFFGSAFVNSQQDYLNTLSNRELFLVNNSFPVNSPIDIESYLCLTQDQMNTINKVVELESVYPYFEFKSTGLNYNQNEFIQCGSISVHKNNDEVNTVKFSGTGVVDLSSDTTKYSVLPYVPSQTMDKKVEIGLKGAKEENAVYITGNLANILGIKPEDAGITLDIDVLVPGFLKSAVVEMQTGRDRKQYDADGDVCVLKTLNLSVAGILRDDVRNTYSDSGQNNIYMPYDRMKEIMADARAEMGNSALTDSDKEWAPSALIIYAKTYNDIEPAKEKLQKINPNFKVVSAYQDITSMNKNMENVRNGMFTVSIVILAVVFLLMTIIYINYIVQRRYEIAVLKANGLTNGEVRKIVLTEALLQVLKMSGLAIVISFAVIAFTNALYGMTLAQIGIPVILLNTLMALLSVVLPTICTVSSVNRYKPDKIMRN